MAARFEDWKDKAGTIRTDGESLTTAYSEVENVYTGTKDVHQRLYDQIFGKLASPLPNAILDVGLAKSDIRGCVFLASGCAVDYSDRIDEFNTTKSGGDCRSISTLNSEYAAIATNEYSDRLEKPEADSETGKVSKSDQQSYDSDLAGIRRAEREKLVKEHGRLITWMEGETRRIKGLLEKGPSEKTLMSLWNQGALPSYSYLVFPDIDFSKGKPANTPIDLRDLTPSELKKLQLKLPLASLKTTLSGEAKAVFVGAEGKVSTEIRVMPDGSVKVIVHTELGGTLDLKQYGDWGGGGLYEVEMRFPNLDDAQAWVNGIAGATFKDHHIAENFSSYINKEEIMSVRKGAYVDVSWGNDTAEVTIRGERYTDSVNGDTTWTGKGTLDLEVGNFSGQAEVGGKYITDGNGEFKSLTLSAALEATYAKEAFGTPPGVTDSSGGGARAEGTFTITPETPHYQEIVDSFNNGDVAHALDLAKDNGQVQVAFYGEKTETDGKEIGDADTIGAKYEIEDKDMASVKYMTKPAGQNYWVDVPPIGPTDYSNVID